jgi:hypothetical protein
MADDAHEQIHIDAEPSRCFTRASTFEDYPDWTNDVKQATVLERDDQGRGTRVEYRAAAMGRSVRFVLDYDFTDAPDGFSWSLVEGDMLRALDGRYGFAPEGDGTRVDYRLRVDLAIPLPGLIKRRASGLIMGTALKDLKRVVEETMTDSGPPDAEPRPHPDAVDFDTAGTEERSLPAPSVLESVITELLGAVPEVRDHVLEAADALLDAAKALIDAADRVVRQQRGDEERGG